MQTTIIYIFPPTWLMVLDLTHLIPNFVIVAVVVVNDVSQHGLIQVITKVVIALANDHIIACKYASLTKLSKIVRVVACLPPGIFNDLISDVPLIGNNPVADIIARSGRDGLAGVLVHHTIIVFLGVQFCLT
jgi:hypothetical protein